MTDQPKWRKWIWIGAWLLALVLVGGALTRLGVSRSRAAPPQASVAWTPWPTVTAVPTMAEATIAPEATPGPTATPTILGRVMVPRVGIDTAIVAVGWHLEWLQGQQVAVWDVAKDDAGWHQGTAGLGEAGNCVLSGHIKGTDEGVFRGLSDVVAGDEVWLYPADGRELRYVVTEALLLPETGEDLAQRQENARYMDPTADTRLTLITCWPNWAYTHRVVVIARPAEAP